MSTFFAFVKVPYLFAYPDYQWTKVWGPSDNEAFNMDSTLAPDGNLYVSGGYAGTNVDFDPNVGTDLHTSSGGSRDNYVIKFDSNGNLLWSRTVGSTGIDSANGIDTDSSNNVYFTGTLGGVSETVDLDGTGGTDNCTTGANGAFFVTKYLANGDYAWSICVPAVRSLESKYLRLTSDGNLFITGQIGGTGTQDMNPGVGVENYTTSGATVLTLEPFFQKYDTSGNYIYTRVLSGTGATHATMYTMSIDASDNFYLFGDVQNNIDLDAGAGTQTVTVPASQQQYWFVKYSSAGTYVWHKVFASPSTTGLLKSNAIEFDSLGYIWIAGQYSKDIDFDPDAGTILQTSNSNSNDAFLARYDVDGSYSAFHTLASAGYERFADLKIDTNNNFYMSGEFEGTMDFDWGAGTVNKTESSLWAASLFVVAYDWNQDFLWVKNATGGQQSSAAVDINTTSMYLAGSAYGGPIDYDPDGTHDSITAPNDFGSSTITKFSVDPLPPDVAPSPTAAPTTTPTATATAASSSNSSTASTPIPTPGSYPIITSAEVTDRVITLFYARGYGPVTSYILEYGTSPNIFEHGFSFPDKGTSSSITVNSLNPATQYYFRLTPVNDGASGPKSPIFSATTAVGQMSSKVIDSTTDNTNTSEDKVTEVGYDFTVIIEDTNQNPVSSADIVLSNTDLSYTETTDSFGQAQFENILAGKYDVRVTDNDGNILEQALIVTNDSDGATVSFTFPTTQTTTQENSKQDSFQSVLSAITSLDVEEAIIASAPIADKTVTYGTAATGVLMGIGGIITSVVVSKTLFSLYSLNQLSMFRFPFDYSKSMFQWLGVTSGLFIHRKKSGVVFNTINLKPLESAFVVYFSPSGNLATAFSDQRGQYSVNLKPDNYSLRAEKNGYLYPSNIIKSSSTLIYSNVYVPGTTLSVPENNSIPPVSVAMDPKDKGLSMVPMVRSIVVWAGIPISLLAAVFYPTTLNIGITLVLITNACINLASRFSTKV